MLRKNKKKVFFATTNIEEYWSREHPIIFAGHWCLSNKDDFKKFQSNTIPYQWSDAKKVIEAQIYCEEVFEKILINITDELNKFFSLKHSSIYYRVLLGNWLIHYIHQCYDKYCCIKKAKEDFDIFTYYIGKNKSEDSIPYDFKEFISSSLNPEYQVQLFSELFEVMNIEIKKIEGNSINNHFHSIIKLSLFGRIRNWFAVIKNRLSYFLLLLVKRIHKTLVIIENPYFKFNSIKNKINIFIRSKGKIYFHRPVLSRPFAEKKIIDKFRYSSKIVANNFEEIIYLLVKKNIPKVYLEYHHDYSEYVNKVFNFNKNDISWLSFQWSGNTVFEYIVAITHNNSNIILAQHGSGYGVDKIHSLEKNERSIAKKYFTYGWEDSSKTIPLSLPNIKVHKNIDLSKKAILFVNTTRPLHLMRFHNGSNSSQNLIDNVESPIIFLNHCKFTKYVIGRFHSSDSERWNNFQRINKHFPLLKRDRNKSFYKSLKEIRMVVSDHLGTTFYESLQANVPIIIFINPQTYTFRDQAENLIEKLIKNKIIFFDPKEASLHVNDVYQDINTWWSSSKIQSLREEVLRKHCYTSNNWINDWYKKLL